jgi:nucleotide-binding universal stress UspA family protein
MGVNRRPGDTFFLGNTAEAVAARFQGPVLFIADTE